MESMSKDLDPLDPMLIHKLKKKLKKYEGRVRKLQMTCMVLVFLLLFMLIGTVVMK